MNQSYLKHPIQQLSSTILETERCTLKTYHTEGVDFESLTRNFCEANKDKYVSQLIPTVEQEKEFIEGAVERVHAWEELGFFIYEKWKSEIVGCCGMNALLSPEPNIGLWIVPRLHGQWFWTEVYRALIDWAKTHTNFTFLRHGCNPENQASIELAKKFGWILQDWADSHGTIKFYIPL